MTFSSFLHTYTQTLNNHYPERVLRILVVNAPRYVPSLFPLPAPFSKLELTLLPFPPNSFFGPIFKLLSTVMPASLRDQLQICSSIEDIEKFISLDVLPPEYGGKSPFKLGEAEEEVSLRALVMKNNVAAGVVSAAST